MAHHELAMALWEAEIGKCIPEHSAVLWWLRDGPGGVFEDTPHEGRTE